MKYVKNVAVVCGIAAQSQQANMVHSSQEYVSLVLLIMLGTQGIQISISAISEDV